VTLSVGEPAKLDTQAMPEGFEGGGLAVVMTIGGAAALALLPEGSGLVPSWCSAPDATGQSKLATLAQELGMTVLPEEFIPDDFKAAWVKSLSGAIGRGGVSDGAAMLPLDLSGEEKRGEMLLVWPASKPDGVLGALGSTPGPKAQPTAQPAPQPKPELAPQPKPKLPPKPVPKPKPAEPARRPATLETLPDYTRSLLRIRVPVVVTLARKRQRFSQIVELGPGSIIHFDKSCEEMLDLEVDSRHVATGEAVKVGDKFGIRITSMILPDERFRRVRPPTAAGQ